MSELENLRNSVAYELFHSEFDQLSDSRKHVVHLRLIKQYSTEAQRLVAS
jgi:hypothetical protein